MYLQPNSGSASDPPAVMWRRFGIWGVLALLGLLALDGFSSYSGLIVLGWAFGMVVAGTLLLVRQR